MKQKFNVGQKIWFNPPYFAYAFPGEIQIRDGELGIWINFFGDAQCFFPITDKTIKYILPHLRDVTKLLTCNTTGQH